MARLRSKYKRRFSDDRSGATAVEFGLIALPFLLTLTGLFDVGFNLYSENALANATQTVARDIMTGEAQGMTQSGQQLTSTEFVTSVVCPLLPAQFSCGNVIVNIQTFGEALSPDGFYAFVNANQSGLVIPTLSNSSTTYCLGTGGTYVYLQILYPLPLLTGVFSNAVLTTYNGSKTWLLMATAAFKNEPFPAGSFVSPQGC